MTLNQVLLGKQAQLMYKNKGVKYLGLFGSQVRGDHKKNSDVDLLVDFNQVKSLFELAEIKIALEKLLNKPVDLVLKPSLKPSLKPFINKNLVTIYEEK